MPEEDAEQHLELIVYQCKELYIYKIPPAGSLGHRAELWNVDHWLQEVSMKVITSGEVCWIRLYDLKSGELFGECPIPKPGEAPLSTAVETVIDSSRYFVLRIVDSESGRHAFVGIGFRERGQASDFNAAIMEHLQYIRRAREAERMRAAHEDREDGTPSASSSTADLSLKPGETMTLRLATAKAPSKSSFFSNRAPTAFLPILATSAQATVPLQMPPTLQAPSPGGRQELQGIRRPSLGKNAWQEGRNKEITGDSPELKDTAVDTVSPDKQSQHTGRLEQTDWGDFVS